VIGDAEAGGLDHAEIVGAVTDDQCVDLSRSKNSQLNSVASFAARPRIGSATLPDNLPSSTAIHWRGFPETRSFQPPHWEQVKPPEIRQV
jgi:hypothetical protein